MRKQKVWWRQAVVLCIALLLLAQPIAVGGTIVGSQHDLSSGNTTEICAFCHTPHQANALVTDAPLWNRHLDTSTVFTPYSSPTLDTTVGQPTSKSLICMSCHDGVNASAVNSYGFTGSTKHDLVKAPGQGSMPDTTSDPNCERCHAEIYLGRATKWLTTDLSDDHPISMAYPTPAQDSEFNTPPDAQNGWGDGDVKLVNGKIECVSCHRVHDPEYPPFLVKPNTNSALCVTCHKK